MNVTKESECDEVERGKRDDVEGSRFHSTKQTATMGEEVIANLYRFEEAAGDLTRGTRR